MIKKPKIIKLKVKTPPDTVETKLVKPEDLQPKREVDKTIKVSELVVDNVGLDFNNKRITLFLSDGNNKIYSISQRGIEAFRIIGVGR